MIILGISCYYHDSAAAILVDGEIVAAAQEERFTRKKHDAGFPFKAVEYCLKTAGVTPGQVDLVAFYDKPFLKFERILETHLQFAPKGIKSVLKSIPIWIKEKLWISEAVSTSLGSEAKIVYPEHHLSHAASAFFPSPFEEAAVITMDGVGEWATTTIGVGEGNDLRIIREINFPHSLGLLYSAFTYYCGFKVNSGEYKLMGLAPYGNPVYADIIRDNLVDIKPDGSFRMNMDYFGYADGLTMTNRKFDSLFGEPPRKPETPMSQKFMDIAASIQVVTEEIMLKTARFAREITGKKNLCLSGGVALNCVGNGKIQAAGIFEQIWIQPASGDAGGALGAALSAWYGYLDKPRIPQPGDAMKGSYLGPSFTNDEIAAFLKTKNAVFHHLTPGLVVETAAKALADGKVVGWVQGRMEFGPRALGARSILGDARSPEMQKTLNLKIKFRESFRPFAPSVLREKVSEWFDLDADSPYMLLVAPVESSKLKPVEGNFSGMDRLYQLRSDIPAVTHVDNSARVQTVHKSTNPRYYALIEAFETLTGCPVIVNTSYNVRGEPIVCTPEDAYRCFMRTNMDVLVMEDIVLYKQEQPDWVEHTDWKDEYELD
jgi:carbamoyltransferase